MKLNRAPRDRLVMVPLGGCGEIGMNLTLYGTGGKWLMVDCGMTFADESVPAVDLIVPDPTYIADQKQDLLGIVVTHAHEDHLGAIHHLWLDLKCPVYATPFAAEVLKSKLDEADLTDEVPLHIIDTFEGLQLGDFNLEMVSLTHSTAEMQALAIRTPYGTVMHTGDWKFDPDPLVGPASDTDRLGVIGDEGILALVCDSTNVFNRGSSGSESEVRKSLIDLVKARAGRGVAITTFASNIARMASAFAVAEATDRHVVMIGRSLWKFYKAARAAGYLADLQEPLSDREGDALPRDKVLFLCTGCQGEPRGAMGRIAADDHPLIAFNHQDTVIFSSKVIPGNEKGIGRVYDQLTVSGVEVITERDEFVHVSGHPGRDELRRMYELTRPEMLVPVHGEARHLIEQSRFGKACGIEKSPVITNGDVLHLAPGEPEILGEVPVGRLAVDASGLVPVGGELMRSRKRALFNGTALAVLVVDSRGELLEDLRLHLMGLAEGEELEQLLDDIEDEIETGLERLVRRRKADDDAVEEMVTRTIRRICRQMLKRRPIVRCEIVRLEPGDKFGNNGAAKKKRELA